MTENAQLNTSWTNLGKFAFLFFFVYFTWHIFLSPDLHVIVFGFRERIFQWFDKFYTPAGLWLNDHLFHFPFDKETQQPESVIDFTQHLVFILGSVIISFIWFLADRKRKSYNDLHYWLTIMLRISLCIITFSYGIIKLIPLQAPTPNLYQLTNSLGNQNGLLWPLLGVGKTYQSFCGLTEVIAALLILYNRTLVLGLLMLLGIYLNVCMMNYSFNIGVLYFALFLFIATIFLLHPYIKSLTKAFVLQQPTSFKNAYNNNSKYKLKGYLLILIGIFVFSCLAFNTINAVKRFHKIKIAEKAITIFKVKEHIVSNDTLLPIENSKNRWRYWVEDERENKKTLMIYSMDINNRLRYYISKDTQNHKIILTPRESEETVKQNDTLNYTKKSVDEVLINGKINGNPINLLLQNFSLDSFPLLKKKPHFLPIE